MRQTSPIFARLYYHPAPENLELKRGKQRFQTSASGALETLE